MKKLIFIPLLLLSLIVSATNYYVKNGGSDVAAGTSDGTAWASLSKVSGVSFNAGDSIFFKRGNIFRGTLTITRSGATGNPLYFGAYGAGEKPVLTTHDTIAGITWSAYGSDGIYSTTDISYNPGDILINDSVKICKIHDSFFSTADSRYGGYTSLQLMALATDYKQYIADVGVNINFWDGLDALYCYNSGTTYIRFRGEEDPNDSTLFISAEDAMCVYIYNPEYITIRGLKIRGGETGIYIRGSYTNTGENIVIDSCDFESCDRKISSYYDAGDIEIKNCSFTTNYLTTYTPGGWIGAAATELAGIYEHFYEFAKYRRYTGTSQAVDCAVNIGGSVYYSHSDNCRIHDNTVYGCVDGILVFGDSNYIYNNTIRNTSSLGTYVGAGGTNVRIYDNEFENVNIPCRVESINYTGILGRSLYFFRNKIYNPTGGEFLFLHGNLETNTSSMVGYVYHNTYVGRYGIKFDGYAGLYPDGTDFLFVNNIISTIDYNAGGFAEITTKANTCVYYYNWTGGQYYGGSIYPWATDASNLNYPSDTFWDHSTEPDMTSILGTEVIDAGIDVSQDFVIGDTTYGALPGFTLGYEYGAAPDIGYFEYEGDVPPAIPLVSTTEPVNVNIKQGTSGGNVTYDGEGTVSDRGICWSTSVNPTTADSKVSSGNGLGSFSAIIIGLSSSTTYHVRAFAINETGTAYGVDIEFTTPDWGVGWHGGKAVFHEEKIEIIR